MGLTSSTKEQVHVVLQSEQDCNALLYDLEFTMNRKLIFLIVFLIIGYFNHNGETIQVTLYNKVAVNLDVTYLLEKPVIILASLGVNHSLGIKIVFM